MSFESTPTFNGHSSLPFVYPTETDLAELSQKTFVFQLPEHQKPTLLKLVNRLLTSIVIILNEDFLSQFAAQLHGSDSQPEPVSISSNRSNSTEPQNSSNSVADESLLLLASSSTADNRAISLAKGAETDPLHTWTLYTNIKSNKLSNFPLLKGKSVVIKDTVSIRSIPLSNGTNFQFIPDSDAPVISRLLSHGATIVGVSRCEFICYDGGSHTGVGGPVYNPHSQASPIPRTSGGSSSGSAVLVANGSLSLAIGSDQGGSIRLPSCWSGCVGMKPTHGLVPYTGICSLYSAVDHVGPITDTVENNALLLSSIAGWDGVDKRATDAIKAMCGQSPIDYVKACENPQVKGMKIALVEEGMVGASPAVIAAIEAAIKRWESLGVICIRRSIPLHSQAPHVWAGVGLAGAVETLFGRSNEVLAYDSGVDEERRSLDRNDFFRNQLLDNGKEWPVNLRVAMLAGEWVRQQEQNGCTILGTAKKCVAALRAAYNNALSDVDALFMPTIPFTAPPLPAPYPADPLAASPELMEEHMAASLSMTVNTISFNVTHHPALSLPIGMERQIEFNSLEIRLPIGGQLVGRHLNEATLYKLANALEKEAAWRQIIFEKRE